MGLILLNMAWAILLSFGILEQDARIFAFGILALHVFNAAVVLVLTHLVRRLKKDA